MIPERATVLPEVVVNMAMTADGKIATAGREVTTFGSPRDLDALYRLRASADAVLCGARTVEETGATLGTGGIRYGRLRIRDGLSKWPLRVVVSGRGTLSPEAKIWTEKQAPLVILLRGDAPAETCRRLEEAGAVAWRSPQTELDLQAGLAWLSARFGVRRLVCEGGGTLNAAMFRQGLVDELRLTLCPRIFGGRTAPTIADGVGAGLGDATLWETPTVRRVGDELFLAWRRKQNPARDLQALSPLLRP